jgi:anti-sigma factor RsiW
MSHLGRRLSALIDGELGDTEREQAHAHLVSCEACRAEAAALRTLKRRVHGLGETPADGALTRRLIALEGLAETAKPRSRVPGATRARAAISAFASVGAVARPSAWEDVQEWFGVPAMPEDVSALTAAPATATTRGRGHTRYVVAGAVAALAVGLGGASFAAGGGERLPGPIITPEVDVYNAQHAATTGELPLFTSEIVHAARQPVPAARQSALSRP